jgi:hypothetical protein
MGRLKLRAIGSRQCVDAMRSVAATVCLAACAGTLAAQDIDASLTERARAAERIVVGRVASSQPVWRMTEHGDRLIVTILRVHAGC